jgi:dephospho-CoA kinase
VLAEDTAVLAALRQRWGNAVFSVDGHVDRAAVARRVFAEDDQAMADREFLEDLLHPRIRRRLEALRQQFAAEGKRAAVLDAPLLLEAGWGAMCDVVLLIDAPRQARREWARQRGWTEEEFARREAAQWPVEQKRRAADVIIQNNGSIDQLRDAVRNFWEQQVKTET